MFVLAHITIWPRCNSCDNRILKYKGIYWELGVEGAITSVATSLCGNLKGSSLNYFCLISALNSCFITPYCDKWMEENYFLKSVFIHILLDFDKTLCSWKTNLKDNFSWFKHAASLLRLPLTCQYRRRKHIWSNHYRALWTES